MKTELDKNTLRTAFERSALSYDKSAVLQREIGERMLERLDLIKLQPAVIVDVGCGTGYCTQALARRYRKARVVGVDIAHAMAQYARSKIGWFGRERYVCADAEGLPMPDNSVDLLFSSLALQWCEPSEAFKEFYRVLRPGGLLMFSSFGPDTLHELRHAWHSVDELTHVHEFIDMHDLGDTLLHTRFADPVMDMEHFTLTYADVMALMRDLKNLGAHNAARDRMHGLTGKQRFTRFKQAYQARATDGRIPATYEVVYGHAWVPQAKPPARATAGSEVVVPVNRIGRRGGGGG